MDELSGVGFSFDLDMNELDICFKDGANSRSMPC